MNSKNKCCCLSFKTCPGRPQVLKYDTDTNNEIEEIIERHKIMKGKAKAAKK